MMSIKMIHEFKLFNHTLVYFSLTANFQEGKREREENFRLFLWNRQKISIIDVIKSLKERKRILTEQRLLIHKDLSFKI